MGLDFVPLYISIRILRGLAGLLNDCTNFYLSTKGVVVDCFKLIPLHIGLEAKHLLPGIVVKARGKFLFGALYIGKVTSHPIILINETGHWFWNRKTSKNVVLVCLSVIGIDCFSSRFVVKIFFFEDFNIIGYPHSPSLPVYYWIYLSQPWQPRMTRCPCMEIYRKMWPWEVIEPILRQKSPSSPAADSF